MSKRLGREVKRDVEKWRGQRGAKAPPEAAVASPSTGPARVPREIVPPTGVRVGESPGKGRGVFATRPIARGEVVEVAPVIVVPPAEQAGIDGTHLESYLFLWQDTVAFALGLGALYNHAWDPNLEYKKRFEEHVIEFVALRDIAPGEELVTNYSSSAPERAGLWSYLS
ncbi:MAG: SET domain-containing protein-lysine N-methyltransferase [Deltaproteobacteria bacterium]|nr:SET domain-containing protein-lysine N-methyltransferase [Deltaproteobacteria bacterium]